MNNTILDDKPTTEPTPAAEPDKRDEVIQKVQNMCNRLGFLVTFKKSGGSEFMSHYFDAFIKLDNEFTFAATGNDNNHDNLLYAGKLIRKMPDKTEQEYDLNMYGADYLWVDFIREWKIFRSDIVARIEKRDILKTLANKLIAMANNIDLIIKQPETKEEKYDWMIAVEEAHKMIAEGK